MKKILILTFFLASIFITMAAVAQKGAGDATGISKQGLNPELVELKGVVQSIKSGPCENTKGKSTLGTHMMVETSGEVLNIHLGPTTEVADFVANAEGEEVVVTAFQTDKLPSDHYIAKEFILRGKTYELRDDNLKPEWAGKRKKKRKAASRN